MEPQSNQVGTKAEGNTPLGRKHLARRLFHWGWKLIEPESTEFRVPRTVGRRHHVCACHFGVLEVGVAVPNYYISACQMFCGHTAIAICKGVSGMRLKVVHIVDCAQAARILKIPV